MSERKEITQDLFERLTEYVNPNRDPRIYCAREVTFDNKTPKQRRVDYMRFKPLNNTVSGIEKGDFYCYEIKSCLDDFNSGHGQNFIGDYNYFVMPEELYNTLKKRLLGLRVGVLIPIDRWEGNKTLTVVKKAPRCNREKPMSEMLLMMFRSAMRDVIKLSKTREASK